MSRSKQIDIPAVVKTVEEEIVTIHHYLSVGRVTAVVVTGTTVDGVFTPDLSIPERNHPIDEGDYQDMVKLKPDKQFTINDLWPFIDRIETDGHKPKTIKTR